MGESNLPVPVSEEKSEGPIKWLSFLKDTAGMKWFRHLVHNLGGRKLLIGGGALAVIREVALAGQMSMARGITCLALGLVSIGIAWTIASEDKSKHANGGEK